MCFFNRGDTKGTNSSLKIPTNKNSGGVADPGPSGSSSNHRRARSRSPLGMFDYSNYTWANYPGIPGQKAQEMSPTKPFGQYRFEVRGYGRGLRDRHVVEEFDRLTGYVRSMHVARIGPPGLPPYRPAPPRSRSITPPSRSPSPRITPPCLSPPRVRVQRPQGPVVRRLSFTEPPPPASPPSVVDVGEAVVVGEVGGVGAAVVGAGVARAATPPLVAAEPAPIDEPPPHPLPRRSGRIRRRPDRYGETQQASQGPKPRRSGRVRRPPCRYQSIDFRR